MIQSNNTKHFCQSKPRVIVYIDIIFLFYLETSITRKQKNRQNTKQNEVLEASRKIPVFLMNCKHISQCKPVITTVVIKHDFTAIQYFFWEGEGAYLKGRVQSCTKFLDF